MVGIFEQKTLEEQLGTKELSLETAQRIFEVWRESDQTRVEGRKWVIAPGLFMVEGKIRGGAQIASTKEKVKFSLDDNGDKIDEAEVRGREFIHNINIKEKYPLIRRENGYEWKPAERPETPKTKGLLKRHLHYIKIERDPMILSKNAALVLQVYLSLGYLPKHAELKSFLFGRESDIDVKECNNEIYTALFETVYF